MKQMIKYIFAFLSLIIFFCISLTLTSKIPTEYIEHNVCQSANILKYEREEDNYFRFTSILKWKRIIVDSLADAIMINNAYSIDTAQPFYSAMMARRDYVKGLTETIYPDKVGELTLAGSDEVYDQIEELYEVVNKNSTESYEYARYWHGYLIFVRPILVFMRIDQIRVLLTVILAILGGCLLLKIYKQFNLGTAIIFLMGMIVCDYFYIGMSMQGSFVFIICMIVSLLQFNKKLRDKMMTFLITGSLTCFFDFLTVPIITLCIPMLIYTLLRQKEDNNLNYKKLYLSLFSLIIMWGIGYFGTWFSKWMIMDILYNKNMIELGFGQFMYRSAFEKNIVDLLELVISIVSIPFMIAILITIGIQMKRYVNGYQEEGGIKKGLPYLVIMLIPVVWYMVLVNHSYRHCFFTYRNFFVITIGICLFIDKVLPKKDIK